MKLPDHIAYAYEPLNEVALDQWAGILSEAEQAYLETVSLDKRRLEFTAGRIVARNLAGRILDLAPREVEIRVEEDGSLTLQGVPYGLSLAHTREGVCAVLARGTAIGIDLEIIRPRRQDLYRFVLHPDEYALFDTIPLDRERTVILCWALKEAALKGMKTGFRCSPKQLRLDIDANRQHALIQTPEKGVWHARYEERDGSYLAIAYPDPEPPPLNLEP